MSLTLYKENSQFIQCDGFKDQSVIPPAYLNDATLSAVLNDRKGVAVAGAASMTGVYVAGSNGSYRFTIDPTQFNPQPGSYTLVITGSHAGAAFHAELPVSIKVRNTVIA